MDVMWNSGVLHIFLIFDGGGLGRYGHCFGCSGNGDRLRFYFVVD